MCCVCPLCASYGMQRRMQAGCKKAAVRALQPAASCPPHVAADLLLGDDTLLVSTQQPQRVPAIACCVCVRGVVVVCEKGTLLPRRPLLALHMRQLRADLAAHGAALRSPACSPTRQYCPQAVAKAQCGFSSPKDAQLGCSVLTTRSARRTSRQGRQCSCSECVLCTCIACVYGVCNPFL